MNNTPLNTHLRQATVSSRFSSHPMANEIKSLSKEQLLNRKKYVEIAVNFWTENKEQAPKEIAKHYLSATTQGTREAFEIPEEESVISWLENNFADEIKAIDEAQEQQEQENFTNN